MAQLPRRLARLAGILAGLILIGFVVLHLPSVRARVLERARGYAERDLGIALRASGLGYNVFRRSIELHDVSIASSPGAEPFLEADRASVVFGPAIFRGRTDIDRIALSRPRLTLVRRADGSVNLPPSKGGAPRTEPLRLGFVALNAASIRVEDRLAQRSITLGPFDLSIDTAGAPARPGAFGPGAFSVRAGGIDASGTIAGRLGFDGTRVTFEELTVETKEGRAAASGWADVLGERPAISARVSAAIDLPEAARLARVDAPELGGHLDATADVKGALASPEIALTIASRDASYAPLGSVRLAGRSSITGSRALIQELTLDSAAGALRIEGAVELDETRQPDDHPSSSRMALAWTNLRIDDVARAFGGSLPVRTGSLASGSGRSEFNLRDLQARAWSRVRATATTTIQPASNASPESLALSGNADLHIADNRWSLRHALQARRRDVELGGDVNGRLLDSADGLRLTLGGRTRLRMPDIAALPSLMQLASITVPPRIADGLGGSAIATADLGGTIDRPTAQIDLEARDLRTNALPDTNAALDARLAVDTNGLRADEIRATAGTTSLQASGKYAWRGPFDARVELNEGDLSGIASRFSLPVSLSGSSRVEGTIAGTMSGSTRTGQAVLALSARDVTVEQVQVGIVTGKGTFPFTDGATMTVEAAAPAIGARTQLEILNRAGYPVSGEIALEHDEVAALIPARYRGQLEDVSGKLSATARGSGLLSDPAGIRGRLDLRRLELMVHGTPLRLAAPGSLTLTGDRFAVDAFDFRIGEQTRATLAGQLAVAPLPDPLRLHVGGPLAELIDLGSRFTGGAAVPVRGDGTAALDVRIEGTLDRPLPRGALAVRSPSLAYGSFAPLTGVTVDASIDPTLITLRTAEAAWQGASLRGDGTLPWRVVLTSMQPTEPGTPQTSRIAAWLNGLPAQPARAQFSFRADNLTQAVLKDVVGAERLDNLQANASATVAVEADRLALDSVQATAVIDRASVTLAGVPFTQSVPTRLRLDSGRAVIDDFRWTAEGNTIVVRGETNLTSAQPRMNLEISGALDLRVLSAFASGIASGGTAQATLAVSGPLDTPDIAGSIKIADGELQLDSPRVSASEFEGTIQIAEGRKAKVSLAGLINTGSATLDGTLDLATLAAPLGKLKLAGREVALEYPSGFQTASNVNLELALGSSNSTLSGRIDVLDGTYREALVLSTQLLNFSFTSGIATAAPPAEWLSRTRLNVSVATASDVRIDNNYGRFDIGGTLRLTGTAARPGVIGRLQAAEDGEIYLGGNTYRIERLVVDLTNPRTIAPEVNFSAVTRVGDLPINVELRCPATGACERKVTSLRTGVDDAEAEARLFGTPSDAASAGEGLVRLLSGEFLGVIGRRVGLDSVRLEQEAERRDIFDDPTLISGDVDPATRLTLAKRLGSSVELIYSQNLADDGFTWITSYSGPWGLSWRLLLLDDQSRSYEFRHEPPIGAARTRQRTRPPDQRIAAVTIGGSPGFPEAELRRQLKLTEGDRFTFGDWQRDRDRLERFYRGRGFLEARIRARRLQVDQAGSTGSTEPPNAVTLEYTITRGPTTELNIRGTRLPDAVRDRIASRWASALFDGFLERDARTIVRDYLYREGYLSATVTTAIAQDPGRELKTLTIDASPGASMASRIEVTGNSGLTTEQLLGVVSATDPLSPWLDPASAERLLENHYRAEGFLAADVSVGQPEARGGTSVVAINVTEGSPYSVGHVDLTGLPDLPTDDARAAVAVTSGDRYRAAAIAESVDQLGTRLRRAAYRQVSVELDTLVDARAAKVDVVVRVRPGPRSILRDVEVEGADAGKRTVARSIVLTPDAPLDPAAIRETRRRLYDLDLYRSVDIEIEPVASAAPPSATNPPIDQPVVARIMLEERPRYRVRYGLAVSDEEIGPDERDRRLGFAADFETRNIFGGGGTAGLSLRLRRDQQVGRVTLGAKRLFGLPVRSTVFIEREREQLNPEGALPITADITSMAVEEAYRIWRAIELRHGFRTERNHTFIDAAEADPFDLTVKVARLTTSGLVDRRDDAFDPARGWFTASTVEYSGPNLGSDLRFLKDFAQYSHFVTLGRGVVMASAARLGLARTFDDQVLIPSERFYAGGANSVRGYREDDLGPRSILDDAEGGSALLVLNGELRFPVYRWLKGVGFVDFGNVYPKISDISFTDLQIGVGAGARFDTPFGIIRFDFGIPANRRSFDPRWRVHFGLGHAF